MKYLYSHGSFYGSHRRLMLSELSDFAYGFEKLLKKKLVAFDFILFLYLLLIYAIDLVECYCFYFWRFFQNILLYKNFYYKPTLKEEHIFWEELIQYMDIEIN